jgi:hypothetical protein
LSLLPTLTSQTQSNILPLCSLGTAFVTLSFYCFALQCFLVALTHCYNFSMYLASMHSASLVLELCLKFILHFYFLGYNVRNIHLIMISCSKSSMNEWLIIATTSSVKDYQEYSTFANCVKMGFKCYHYRFRNFQLCLCFIVTFRAS